MKPALLALPLCLTLSACAGNLGETALADRLSGRTLAYEAPPGLPAETDSFHPDGTLVTRFRPWLNRDRLGTREGRWWVEDGRLCRAYGPASTDQGQCHTVTAPDGDTLLLRPWPRLSPLVPDLRRTRVGRLTD